MNEITVTISVPGSREIVNILCGLMAGLGLLVALVEITRRFRRWSARTKEPMGMWILLLGTLAVAVSILAVGYPLIAIVFNQSPHQFFRDTLRWTPICNRLIGWGVLAYVAIILWLCWCSVPLRDRDDDKGRAHSAGSSEP